MPVASPRVLIFHPALAPYRLDLFNALSRRCHVRVLFLRPNALNQRFDQKRLRQELAADHRILTGGLNLGDRAIRFGIGREILDFRPEVVVSTEYSPVTIAVMAHRALARHAFAHVVWTDDNPASIARDGWHRTLARRLVLPWIHGLIVLSDESAGLYRERYGTSAPIGVCPILHEETAFSACLVQAGEIVRALLDEHRLHDRRVVLFVGRLAAEKRVDRLIRAFAHVRRSVQDATLVLVGDGPERASLETLSGSLGVRDETIFAGRQEGARLHAWYRLASVFALTSEHETFGAVVNEALLAGVPVVCSNKAGAKALVRTGTNGSIVDAADLSAVAEGVRAWLDRAPQSNARSRSTMPPSLMHVSFSDAVSRFLDVVEVARERVREPRARGHDKC